MISKKVAIIDYGMGNLFSVARACAHAGLEAAITSDPADIRKSDGVILPGVGAFGDAMAALRERGLVEVLRESAKIKPFLGICLGMQLLMTKSYEFGEHEGLNVIEGEVFRLKGRKVPQVGWNLAGDDYFYFVHSFYVKPSDPKVILTTTRYEDIEFCSILKKGFVFACQFHPERSGEKGLSIYRNFARRVQS